MANQILNHTSVLGQYTDDETVNRDCFAQIIAHYTPNTGDLSLQFGYSGGRAIIPPTQSFVKAPTDKESAALIIAQNVFQSFIRDFKILNPGIS